MKIKKAFSSEVEKKNFIENYFNGNLSSEIIDNLLYSDKSNESLIKYQNFLEKTNDGMRNLNLLQMIKFFFGKKALKKTFGKKDFAIDDIKEKDTWMVQFDNSIFLVPYKNEIIYNNIISKEDIEKAIEFEKEFILFCLDYANNVEKLNKKEKEIFKKGVMIMSSNQLNIKNSYEDFVNKCALSKEEIQELTETYLKGNDENVQELLDELSLIIYNEVYKNNIGKEFVDYNLNNTVLCDADVYKLSKKHFVKNEMEEGAYPFIRVVEIRMGEKLIKKENGKKFKF